MNQIKPVIRDPVPFNQFHFHFADLTDNHRFIITGEIDRRITGIG
jgi:hypothetical protein